MKLVKNYLYNVANQLFMLFVPLITIPYVSRVIGPSGVGVNAFTNSIVSYFVLFGSIGINLYGNRAVAYVRDDNKKVSKTFWEISFLKIITMSFAYISYIIFVLLYPEYKIFLLGQSFLILAAGLDISWFFMGLEDFKKTVVRNVLVKLVSLACIFSFVKTKNDLLIYILILTVSQLLGNLTLWSYLKQSVEKVSFKELDIFQHFLPSLHLFVPQIAIQIYLVLNRTMLGQLSSIDNVGYYDNADKIVKMLLAVVTATGTVMLPRVANTFSKGNLEKVNKYLHTSFSFVCLLSFPLSFGIMGISSNFSYLFFGSEFEGIDKVIIFLAPVVIAISMSNVIGQQFLLPTNQMKEYTLSVTVGALLNLLINFCLLKSYGAIGAAISTVVSEFGVTLLQIFFIKNKVSIRYLFKDIWKYSISSIIMWICVIFFGYCLEGFTAILVQIVLGILIYSILIVFLRPSIIILAQDLIVKKFK